MIRLILWWLFGGKTRRVFLKWEGEDGELVIAIPLFTYLRMELFGLDEHER